MRSKFILMFGVLLLLPGIINAGTCFCSSGNHIVQVSITFYSEGGCSDASKIDRGSVSVVTVIKVKGSAPQVIYSDDADAPSACF